MCRVALCSLALLAVQEPPNKVLQQGATELGGKPSILVFEKKSVSHRPPPFSVVRGAQPGSGTIVASKEPRYRTSMVLFKDEITVLSEPLDPSGIRLQKWSNREGRFRDTTWMKKSEDRLTANFAEETKNPAS